MLQHMMRWPKTHVIYYSSPDQVRRLEGKAKSIWKLSNMNMLGWAFWREPKPNPFNIKDEVMMPLSSLVRVEHKLIPVGPPMITQMLKSFSSLQDVLKAWLYC